MELYADHAKLCYTAFACAQQVLGRVLLPAVALITSSPAVDMELWELLRMLPSTIRYKLYAEQRVSVDMCL